MASLGVPALIVALALAASLFALPAFIRRFRKAALTLLGDRRRPAAVLDGLTAAAAELSVAKGARLFAATALIWGSFFGLCHTASLAVGGAWGPDFSVLAGSAGSLAFALPINGLANLGPFEAAFSGSLVAAGAALELALGAALLVHLVAIAAAVFAAAAAQILVIRTHRAPRNVD